MGAVLQDLRYAVRIFARRRTLTVVAILSLAVATGPNAALFGLINGLFFQHLPVDHPEQLVGLRAMKDARGEAITFPDWIDIRQQATSLAGVIAWERVGFALSIEAGQEVLTGNYVSADYFTVLGVQPAIGRLFSPELDGQPGSDAPLVISHSYWQRRFAGAPDVVGMTVRMAGRPLAIVGVAPRGFRGMDVHFPIDGWIPYSAIAAIWGPGTRTFVDRERGQLSSVLGRLKPDATIAQAEADLGRIGARLAQAYPATNQGRQFRVYSYIDDRNEKGLVAGSIAIGLVSLVLLVACANVAGLLLSLAEARRGEVGVRLSLGASRWRLVRQLLTESVLLWLAGAMAGLLLAAWLMKLPIAPPIGGLTLDYDIHFDWTVFLYAVCLACLTAVLFGLAPALQATKADLVTSVKAGRAGQSPRRHGMRSVLVIGQIAVSQFLLAGTLLGVRSYVNIHEFRPGFDSDKNVLVATLVAGAAGGGPVTPARQDLLVERLRQLPGVVQVSAAGSIPLSGSGGGAMQRVAWPAPPMTFRCATMRRRKLRRRPDAARPRVRRARLRDRLALRHHQ
jgi:putative ABC transport system permease protein